QEPGFPCWLRQFPFRLLSQRESVLNRAFRQLPKRQPIHLPCSPVRSDPSFRKEFPCQPEKVRNRGLLWLRFHRKRLLSERKIFAQSPPVFRNSCRRRHLQSQVDQGEKRQLCWCFARLNPWRREG